MAETEIVGRFKEFARVRLLKALREADDDALAKEPTYHEIREAFTAEKGWPSELDEIEPGPAHTPRWLNRLHWVVAGLVQNGILEPSEGRDTLHTSRLGHDLLRLPEPFRDTPQTRALIDALNSTKPDEQRTAEAEQMITEFRRRFPPDKLGDMTVEEYAIGGGDRDNFCWWLERGLQTLGRYTPGSSRGHLIYKMKSGEIYRVHFLQDMPLQDAMARVAQWHAQIVQVGGTPEPERIDTDGLIQGSPSRVLKVLNSYFPDRFLPINSMAHLGRFLSEFGVPESEVPDGAVARNRLLLRLFQAVGQTRGFSPWDFMWLLYERFDPKPVRLDEARMRGAVSLFRWLYGGGCRASQFVEEEREYKDELVRRWQAVTDGEELARSVHDGDEIEKARELSKALLDPPSNLLSYRYHAPLRDLGDPADARLFVEAVAELLQSGEAEDAVPDVGRFNTLMAPLYDRLDANLRKAASRSIPTLMLMLSYPERDIYVRSDVFSRARQALTKKVGFEDEGFLSTGGYQNLRLFADAVRDAIEQLEPADMIDVQGFLWGVFSHSDLWFGGVSYKDDAGHHEDMLGRFRQHGVYAVGYGSDSAMRELVAGAHKLRADERKERVARIEATASKRSEAGAITAFVEAAARPGSVIIAKSTYYHAQSILRIRGVARVSGDVRFDPELGHTVAADWREPMDTRLALKSFGKLAGTLVTMKLAEALDVLGADEARPSAGAIAEATESEGRPKPPPPLAPDLPKNLILYGPPGTGKTWEVLENIQPAFGERVELITFHPNFAYEEFIEGLRPVSDAAAGNVKYEVVPGVFKRACQQALAHPELPFLLIIDEINRANLASVFGELITLIEEDKRDKGRVTLPYSKERFTVPGNLWIVGTMNTADRSIALMDVALRRRFVFREVAVDYDALVTDFAKCSDPTLADLDLAAILRAMNERLRLLVDREHQIGHAWLFGVRSLDDLRERFARRILPLLAEYFFDDWSRICMVLGEHPLQSASTDLVRKTVVQADRQQQLFGRVVHEGGPVALYDPGDPTTWIVEHFTKIALAEPAEPEVEV